MNAPARWTTVLRAPLQQWRNQGSVWPLITVVGVAIACVLLGLTRVPSHARLPLAVVALATLAACAWLWLAISLQQQNHPHAARLVPGHVQTLRRVFLGSWLLFVAFGAALGALVGYAVPMAAGTAVLLLVLAWSIRLPFLGLVIWLASAAVPRWVDGPVAAALLETLMPVWQHQLEAIVVGAALLLWLAAVLSAGALLRAGGSHHAQAYRNRAKRQAAQRSGGTGWARGQSEGGTMAGVVRYCASFVFMRWFTRTIERRDRDALPRALLGLGPALHWTGQLGQVLAYGPIAGVLLLVIWQINPATHALSGIWLGLIFAAMSVAVSVALQVRTAVYGTRREQALLILLPGMPRGAVLNARLARRLSLQFVCSWALGVLVCVPLLPPGVAAAGWFASFAAACLLLGVRLWSDWSRLRPPMPMTAIMPLLLVSLLSVCAMIAQAWLTVPAWVGVLAFVAAAGLWAAWRGYRLRGVPSAFPAGRRA